MIQSANNYFGTVWNTDIDGNKISISITNEQHVTVDNSFLLNQIPDKNQRVFIDGLVEIDINDKIDAANQFKVDYDYGLVYLHNSKEAQTINVTQYSGLGIIKTYADRIEIKDEEKLYGNKVLELVLRELSQRINNLITSQSGNTNLEITDSHQDGVRNKTFETLGQRLNEDSADLQNLQDQIDVVKNSNTDNITQLNNKINDANMKIEQANNDIDNLENNKLDKSEVVSSAQAGKILKLNSNAKLDVDITGNADTSTTSDNASKLNNKTASGTLNTTEKIDLVAAINEVLTSLGLVEPSGEIAFFARSTAPNGWLKCNGSAVSRTTYAKLFTAIGTTFGVGDGTTTFNLPDLRGEFIRGWDDGKGTDTGRTFGSSQTDSLKAHTHSFSPYGSSPATSGSALLKGAHNGVATSEATDSTGGTETRPRNIALLACIKI